MLQFPSGGSIFQKAQMAHSLLPFTVPNVRGPNSDGLYIISESSDQRAFDLDVLCCFFIHKHACV